MYRLLLPGWRGSGVLGRAPTWGPFVLHEPKKPCSGAFQGWLAFWGADRLPAFDLGCMWPTVCAQPPTCFEWSSGPPSRLWSCAPPAQVDVVPRSRAPHLHDCLSTCFFFVAPFCTCPMLSSGSSRLTAALRAARPRESPRRWRRPAGRNSRSDCACARMAASAARAVHLRASARALASRRSSANASPLNRPPTSRPNTTRRQRPRPPGCSAG